MTLTRIYEEGDLVEVVNPKPTGARGHVIKDDGGRRVTVRWTDHGWGQVGKKGTPLRTLLRLVTPASTGPQPPTCACGAGCEDDACTEQAHATGSQRDA